MSLPAERPATAAGTAAHGFSPAPALAVEPGATFEGLLAFRGHARIGGHVRGEVLAIGTVEISPGARVTGRVEAHEAVIGGDVLGDVDARDRIEVRAGARVQGDLQAPRLAIEDGGRIRGRVRIPTSPEVEAAAATEAQRLDRAHRP